MNGPGPSSAALVAALVLSCGAKRELVAQEPPAGAGELQEALAQEGLELDLDAGLLSMPVSVRIRNELLEYLLVGPNGAAHESLFLTRVQPSLLNAALLLLGVEPGANARVEELASVDERGRPERRVIVPEGDGFYLYVGWRADGQTFFFRVEDLLCNRATGRSLRRHRWVYLGSRFVALSPETPERFIADVDGNLINLSFFFQGNTVLTAALPECYEQTIWHANEWLLPPTGSPARLFFAREPLALLSPALAESLPDASDAGDPGDGPAERVEEER